MATHAPTYTNQVTVDRDFTTVLEDTEAALEAAGFGVLCDIDVSATLEAKLGVDHDNYRILGACIPELAHQAMTEEPDVGALLPCNVVVYESENGVVVSAVSPPALLSIVDNDALTPLADAVTDRLDQVLTAIKDAA